MNPQIYVGTYKKYNEGSLFGKWMNLTDYTEKDEFINACLELHKDESDPEFMFQDWEGIPEKYISECSIDEEYWTEFLPKTEEIEQQTGDPELLEAYLNQGDYGIEDFEKSYQGKYDNDEDFVQELLESCGDIPADLPNYIYIDWERTARDIMMDYFVVSTESGNYYFKNL